MRIAVNTRFLLENSLEGYGYFLYETLRRITKWHPEHEFIFIFDRPVSEQFVFEKNVTPIVAGPPARHPLLWRWWYNIKIPHLLKKYKADVFVSCDGFCSLHIKIPQCLVVHDLSFLHYPAFMKRSELGFYKKQTPKFLNIAKSIATVSEFSKKDILSNYKIDEKKLSVVYSAAKEIFQPLNTEEKEATKKEYTDGKEYFVFTGPIHPRKNPMNLLKAFSVFKKRQQSNMKLVMAGRLAWKYEKFLTDFNNYKYRNDVALTGYVEEKELAKIVGAAYALVYPSYFEGFGVPVLEAMHCHVPVITSMNSPMQEITEGAALYVDPSNYEDIADRMMRLYKDENLRNELIKKGQSITSRYTWDKTADLLWQSILKAVK